MPTWLKIQTPPLELWFTKQHNSIRRPINQLMWEISCLLLYLRKGFRRSTGHLTALRLRGALAFLVGLPGEST
ncbi:hypothetical protein HZH68_014824 [Vespula germanica]|uniref:Uncharacterized protein n=2 Tax=Vespula TaxID=7451 RepID=A0A834J9R8_VESGE|nr:hypothetical protein HZH68_014824 [Vespula germanica]